MQGFFEEKKLRRLLSGSRLLFLLAIPTGAGDTPPLPPVVPPQQSNICVVVWSQNAAGFSAPTNLCLMTNGNVRTAWWEPVSEATNYVLGWSRQPITNLVPGPEIQWTNTGLNTTQTFFVVPPIPSYGLIFLQASTNGLAWYDLTNEPYLRLTNGAGDSSAWQWFRSRTEITTNWK